MLSLVSQVDDHLMNYSLRCHSVPSSFSYLLPDESVTAVLTILSWLCSEFHGRPILKSRRGLGWT
jgi:hypothetical protein